MQRSAKIQGNGKLQSNAKQQKNAGTGLSAGMDAAAFSERLASLSHNRTKKYVLHGSVPVPFLVDLGVMTAEGKVVKSRYDKFRQINRFLEFIEDVLPNLDPNRTNTIIDFGCGEIISDVCDVLLSACTEKIFDPCHRSGFEKRCHCALQPPEQEVWI